MPARLAIAIGSNPMIAFVLLFPPLEVSHKSISWVPSYDAPPASTFAQLVLADRRPCRMSRINALPPTLNFHIVPHCSYRCKFCFAHLVSSRGKPLLTIDVVRNILRDAWQHGVTRVRYAGGEPTLHPALTGILRATAEIGLVPSVVTHGREIEASWIERNCPQLRILTLSVDSDSETTEERLGRRLAYSPQGHVSHVEQVCQMIHRWNSIRPAHRRVRLTFNMTVTSLNADEYPADFLRRCRPERVKLFQMLRVEGENDAYENLLCDDERFRSYVERLLPLTVEGIDIVAESAEDMTGSYAMLDPHGRFFQNIGGRYVYSRPVQDVGIEEAFRQVGGYDADKFVSRGADYDPGAVPKGNPPYWIAIDGLDNSSKNTVINNVTERLEADVFTNRSDASLQRPDLVFDARRVPRGASPQDIASRILELIHRGESDGSPGGNS